MKTVLHCLDGLLVLAASAAAIFGTIYRVVLAPITITLFVIITITITILLHSRDRRRRRRNHDRRVIIITDPLEIRERR